MFCVYWGNTAYFSNPWPPSTTLAPVALVYDRPYSPQILVRIEDSLAELSPNVEQHSWRCSKMISIIKQVSRFVWSLLRTITTVRMRVGPQHVLSEWWRHTYFKQNTIHVSWMYKGNWLRTEMTLHFHQAVNYPGAFNCTRLLHTKKRKLKSVSFI